MLLISGPVQVLEQPAPNANKGKSGWFINCRVQSFRHPNYETTDQHDLSVWVPDEDINQWREIVVPGKNLEVMGGQLVSSLYQDKYLRTSIKCTTKTLWPKNG